MRFALLAVAAGMVLVAAVVDWAYSWIRALYAVFPSRPPPTRVAVIGGGIAGFGAAHALCQSGIEVDLYESCQSPGGNAKTHCWPDGVVTGLSVLAWPVEYFRNYGALLRQLGMPSTPVDLRFYLRRADGESFVHGKHEALSARYARDMRRWARMVALVRSVNRLFSASDAKSLYHFSLLNPMNLLPLRWLAFACGVSAGFWRDVITPLHCTTFLTTELELVPAVVLPVIDDLIPLAGVPRLESWIGSSAEVFAGIATAAGTLLRVHTGCTVERVLEAEAADPMRREALEEITRKTRLEVASVAEGGKACAFGPFTPEELDAKFGADCWRCMHRFSVDQGVDEETGEPKRRVCDNA